MKRTANVMAVGLLALAVVLFAAMGNGSGHATEQALCPVTDGNPVDRSIYTDYQGKRVYFCCALCKAAFEKEPDKYLHKLPQFAGPGDAVSAPAPDHEHGAPAQTSGLRLHRFTEPLGIATFSFLVLTLCTGLLRRKLKRRFLRVHMPLAITTVVVAALHALTVLLGH